MKQIVWEWEFIDGYTRRTKVVGGWLVVAEVVSNKGGVALTSIFIPDQHWEWHPCAPFVDPQIRKAEIAKDFKA